MAAKSVKLKYKLKVLQVLKQTFLTWKADFNTFSKLVLVLAIPSAVMNVLNTQGLIGEYGLLLSIAWSFVIIAIILFGSKKEALENHMLSTLLTAASARFLQYLGVSLILLFFVLLVLLGIFGLFLAAPLLNVSPIIFMPLGAAGLGLGLYLLSRYALAQSFAVIEKKSIFGSLSASSQLTKHNRLKIVLGYMAIVGLSLLVLTAVQFLMSLNQSINENAIIGGVVYVLEAVVLVPIFFIFQVELYKALHAKKSG